MQNPSQPEPPEAVPDLPEDLPDGVVLERFRTSKEAHEYGLVILSQRIPYWVQPHAGAYYLMVTYKDMDTVRPQLDKYRKERASWPPRPLVLPNQAGGRDSLWFVGIILLTVFALSTRHDLNTAGMADNLAILQNAEIWRLVTALTLHGDFAHLASNLIAGAVFCFFVLQYLGVGVGWLLILISGIAGNLLNAWFYAPQQHLSIGASTAVFGAIGILAAFPFGVAVKEKQWPSLKLWLSPLLGGGILLAWLGLGTERTDFMAHAWGFSSGVLLAVLAGVIRYPYLKSKPIQTVTGALCVAVLSFAWWLAVR